MLCIGAVRIVPALSIAEEAGLVVVNSRAPPGGIFDETAVPAYSTVGN